LPSASKGVGGLPPLLLKLGFPGRIWFSVGLLGLEVPRISGFGFERLEKKEVACHCPARASAFSTPTTLIAFSSRVSKIEGFNIFNAAMLRG